MPKETGKHAAHLAGKYLDITGDRLRRQIASIALEEAAWDELAEDIRTLAGSCLDQVEAHKEEKDDG